MAHLFWMIQLQCGSDITGVGIQNYATTYMINLCSENDDSRLYAEIFTDFVIFLKKKYYQELENSCMKSF